MRNPPASPLSAAQQSVAQRLLLRFFTVNGIVVPCVMESFLVLWALRNGLSAPQVAILTSFLFLAMPMMYFGKHVTARLGMIRAWSLCWTFRYIFILAMLPAPWFRESALQPFIPYWILGCTFLFFSFRSMGMINPVPITGEVTTAEDQGSFQAKITLRITLGHLSMLGLIILIFRQWNTTTVYQLILGFGCTLGILSARMLLRIPERPAARLAARGRLFKSMRTIIRNTRYRRLTVAWCAFHAASTLLIPIAVLTLKQGYAVEDNLALSFTLLELLGGILASVALTVIADHTGPRPMLVLGMSLFWAVAVFWGFAPQRFVPLAVGGAFLAGGIARTSQHLALNHYLLATTTTRERLNIGLLIQMFSGAVSGFSGIVIAGLLLRYLPAWTGQGLPLYRTYYRVLILLLPFALWIAIRLPRLQDWSVRNVIGLVFSSRDLRALATLNRLRKDTSDEADQERIDHLGELASIHSEPVLRDFLRTGRLAQRAHAIRALHRIPFGDATVQALIHEVRNGAFTNGWRAAELLGQRRIRAAIPALRAGLHSDDPFLQGKCIVGLARLGDRDAFQDIRRLFRESRNPRIVIHGAIAMGHIRDPADLGRVLEKTVERDWPQPVMDELLLCAATLRGCNAEVHRLLRTLRRQPQAPGQAEHLQPDGPSETVSDPPIDAFLRAHPTTEIPASMRQVLAVLRQHASRDGRCHPDGAAS